jgi:hypothetical protein
MAGMDDALHSCQPGGRRAVDARPVVVRMDHVDPPAPQEQSQVVNQARLEAGRSVQGGNGPTGRRDVVAECASVCERDKVQVESIPVRVPRELDEQLFQTTHIETLCNVSDLKPTRYLGDVCHWLSQSPSAVVQYSRAATVRERLAKSLPYGRGSDQRAAEWRTLI